METICSDVATANARGKPLGSFGTFCDWCSGSLLALGCADPPERIADAKVRDPMGHHHAALFEKWALNKHRNWAAR